MKTAKKLVSALLFLCLVLGLAGCDNFKDNFLDGYNDFLQFSGRHALTKEKGDDAYVGSYTAEYKDFDGEKYLFGGAGLERDGGNELTVTYTLTDVKGEDTKEETDPPEIAGTVDNMDDYDTIFLGYPIWWGDTPTIIKVFLQSYDFSDKTICPLITHGGSGFSGSLRDIARLCPNAKMTEGLAINGDNTTTCDKDLEKWVKKIGLK